MNKRTRYESKSPSDDLPEPSDGKKQRSIGPQLPPPPSPPSLPSSSQPSQLPNLLLDDEVPKWCSLPHTIPGSCDCFLDPTIDSCYSHDDDCRIVTIIDTDGGTHRYCQSSFKYFCPDCGWGVIGMFSKCSLCGNK